jgi:hypothetical protein
MMPASETPSALIRMQCLLNQWALSSDRRAIFLSCYERMTRNMLFLLDKGIFYDPPG